MGSNKDNGGNRGHMQQSIKRSSLRNNGGGNGDWQGDNCNNGNKGSGDNGKRDG